MPTITTRPCMICNKASVLEVEESELAARNAGAMVQDAFPTRDTDFRELVISGTHPECWDATFGEEE